MAAAVTPYVARSQDALKPTIMVMPSELLMAERGYCRKVTIDGRDQNDCDFGKLLSEDKDFASVVSAVSTAFQERGFPIKKLEDALENAREEAAGRLASRRAIQETMLDILMRSEKPDIGIKVKLDRTELMGQRRVIVDLDAVDAYTSEPVATKQMSSQPSATLTTGELATAVVVAIMPDIEARLLAHFQRMATEGRRVRLRVELTEAAGLSEGMDTEITASGEDVPLRTYITLWARKFAVNGQYQPGRRSESFVSFSSFNVPFSEDPELFLQTMISQFRKDTGLYARPGPSRGVGDLLVLIDKNPR